MKRSALLLGLPLVFGCVRAFADVPPALTPLDELDAAIVKVEQAAVGVVIAVSEGSLDLATKRPALSASYDRLTASLKRLNHLAGVPDAPAEVPAEVAAESTGTVGTPTGTSGTSNQKPADYAEYADHGRHTDGGATKPGETHRLPPPKTTGGTTDTTAGSTASAGTSGDATPVSASPPEKFEKTGIASIDKFLTDASSLSAQMLDAQNRLSSARGKLTKSLSLAKKFKPADAQQALKDKLGTGYKISMGPPPKITPGPDAKDPSAVSNILSAIGDLQAVQAAIPKLTNTATDLAKKGADIPKSAKNELTALGPVKGMDAIGKVTKQVKTVTKVPKDAKDLGTEVTNWTKILGGG